jgi:hypothetical protein
MNGAEGCMGMTLRIGLRLKGRFSQGKNLNASLCS